MLVLEHNLLEQVVSTIGDIVAPLYDGSKQFAFYFISTTTPFFVDKKCLNFHKHKTYKHERIAYLLYDLR